MAVTFTQLFGLLSNGDFFGYFVAISNFYLPWGIFWGLEGFVLFILVKMKSESLGFAGIITTVWFVGIFSVPNLVTNAFGIFWLRLVGTFIGLGVIFFYLYRLIKN